MPFRFSDLDLMEDIRRRPFQGRAAGFGPGSYPGSWGLSGGATRWQVPGNGAGLPPLNEVGNPEEDEFNVAPPPMPARMGTIDLPLRSGWDAMTTNEQTQIQMAANAPFHRSINDQMNANQLEGLKVANKRYQDLLAGSREMAQAPYERASAERRTMADISGRAREGAASRRDQAAENERERRAKEAESEKARKGRLEEAEIRGQYGVESAKARGTTGVPRLTPEQQAMKSAAFERFKVATDEAFLLSTEAKRIGDPTRKAELQSQADALNNQAQEDLIGAFATITRGGYADFWPPPEGMNTPPPTLGDAAGAGAAAAGVPPKYKAKIIEVLSRHGKPTDDANVAQFYQKYRTDLEKELGAP